VQPVLAGLLVAWDGQWEDSYDTPADFARVQVHVGAAADFTPDATTVAATISNRAGGTVTVATPGYATAYVRLVAVGTAEQPGPPSAAVAGTPRQVDGPDLSALLDLAVWLKDGSVSGSKLVAETIGADRLAANAVVAGKIDAGAVRARELAAQAVEATHIKAGAIEASHIKAGGVTADKLSVGVNGNLIPDPSFETGYVAAELAGQTDVQVVPGGRDSAHALRVTLHATAARVMSYDRFPVTAGERYWAAYDHKLGADYVGSGDIRMSLQWLDSDGAHLSFSFLTRTPLQPDDTWRREAATLTAPPGAAYCRPRLQSPVGTGTCWFDNVELRPVMSSAAGGSRAEVGPDGLRLYDAEGEEAVALVTGRPNYVTLSANGVSVATIDQRGNAAFGDLAVAGRLTVGGDPLDQLLVDMPRGIVAWKASALTVTSTGTEMGLLDMAFTADPARMYRVVLDVYAQPSAAGGEVALLLRDGGASPPSISSPLVQSAVWPMPTAGSRRVRLEDVRSGSMWGAGTHWLLTSFTNQNGPAGQTVRINNPSTLRGFLYVEDIGAAIPQTGNLNTGGGTTTPPAQKYTKTYAASWSGTYANRGSLTTYHGNNMGQGYYSSSLGMQASLVGFPSALATDLSGATILKAEVYLYFEHWYYNSGGTAVIKAHGHASRPATFSSDSEAKSVSWGKNVGQWVDITSVFDSTRWRGIALDPNTSGLTYYGRAQGLGATYPPKLRVTYTK
jgi:hypothetical protein